MDKSLAPQVIGIASGKGGVGKTSVTTNLAVALAKRNHRVMIMDADLGLANAQIALGVHAPFNIGHVLRGEKTLREILVTTPQEVILVPGASGVRDLAALQSDQIHGIVRSFDELDIPLDFLLVDIAAGISPAVLDFLSACQRRVVVVCDQPSAIADAYGLIKVMTTEQKLDEIHLVTNMVGSSQLGRQLHRRMNDVCMRFLGVTVHHLGSIEADELMLQAQRQFLPVLEHAPGSAAARDFRSLADAVAQLPAIQAPSGGVQFFMHRMLRG